MAKRFRILRQIPEVFEVVADNFDEACNMIAEGQIEESESLSDRYELVDETDDEEREAKDGEGQG